MIPIDREFLLQISTAPQRIQGIMCRHQIVINNHDDPLQKMYFTLYSELVELAVIARDYLEVQDENSIYSMGPDRTR